MIKITRNIAMILTAFMMTTTITSCLKDNRTRVECDPFANQDDLAWFAGLEGETLTFKNQGGAEKTFVIEDKYIFHTTSFLTYTGCNCHDLWGMLLSSGRDSVIIYSRKVYNETQEERFDNINLLVDDKFTGFNITHRTLLPTFEIDGVQFSNVIRFQFNHTDNLQFSAIYLARELGIIQLNRMNGEVWVNTRLDRKMSIGFNSFRYTEDVCE